MRATIIIYILCTHFSFCDIVNRIRQKEKSILKSYIIMWCGKKNNNNCRFCRRRHNVKWVLFRRAITIIINNNNKCKGVTANNYIAGARVQCG